MKPNGKYGLVGYPLKHSFSPQYFAGKFRDSGLSQYEYCKYEVKHIREIFNILPVDIDGFNVTIPYKEEIIPYLDEIHPLAQRVGAVNTVVHRDGRWVGYNTDVYGFQRSLDEFLNTKTVSKALILGTGGAAHAVRYTLEKSDIPYTMVSRQPQYLTYNDLTDDIITNHRLIINTTPLGTYPDIHNSPDLPYSAIGPEHFLFDLVYNPEKTLFLKKGAEKGASIRNGYDMLVYQAEKTWEIWNK